MSEEIASADSLLDENAEIRRALAVALAENDQHHAYERALESKVDQFSAQIGEITTTIGYQDAMLAERESQLGAAHAEITRLEAALRWASEMKTIKGARQIVARTLEKVSTE